MVFIETNTGTGSGFLITKNGLCLTCNHVVKDSDEIFVRMINLKGEKEVFKACIEYSNSDEDYAVLKLIDCDNSYYYNLEEDTCSLSTGDDVAIYGFPFGAELNDNIMELEPSLTKGYIASKNKIEGHTCYYLDIRSAPGSSGGPVFSLKNNKVIGYLCGSYGSNRANIVYIRTLQAFFCTNVKE